MVPEPSAPPLELVTVKKIVAPSVASANVSVKTIVVGPGLYWEYGGGGSGVADTLMVGAAGAGGAV